MSEEKAVQVYQQQQDIVPTFQISIEENEKRITAVREFVKKQMKQGEDYGVIAGIDKPSLLKAGAEKLCNIFGFAVEFTEISKIEDWEKGLFAYTYKAVVKSKRTGIAEADCLGSCNSKESKYAYRWLPEFKASEDEKARSDKTETRGAKSGKSFLWYRVPNADIFSQVNTIQKMAQKRAMVGAVLFATRASGFLTQDVEDMETGYYTEPFTPAVSQNSSVAIAQTPKTQNTTSSPSKTQGTAYSANGDELPPIDYSVYPEAETRASAPVKSPAPASGGACSNCGFEVARNVAEYSTKKMGRVLCFDCQRTK